MGTTSGISEPAEASSNLSVEVASHDAFDVRSFSVKERMSFLFEVELIVMSESPNLDFDAIVGHPARFSVHAGRARRLWSGLVSHLEQVRVEEHGLSTHRLRLVPELWLLTQRRNYRMFQQMSEPEIVLALLREWGIEPVVHIDRAAYKKRKYRVQYAESDYAFLSRMLEDAGISFYFEDSSDESMLVLSDAPHGNSPRTDKLPFHDSPAPGMAPGDYVTKVKLAKRVRPGKYTLRDHDYRLPPNYKLAASASGGGGAEERLERYHYTPGAFLFGGDKGESTPAADDKGKTRTDEGEARILAQKRLDAKRGSAKTCTFETTAHDLSPGMVVHFLNHPRTDLGEDKPLFIVQSLFEGTHGGEWTHRCEARSAEIPYRPALATPKPKVSGVESATVVGPLGEEIHVDEFGRVRVHFHWDRESRMDDNSSCWIHVSEPWGGAGYGGIHLPRIGQEVLVDFLGGDPDRPIIVGRVYTNLQVVPYGLPKHKTRSAWKSNSTGQTGGYNEILFEDLQGMELVYEQAEKNRRQLVKNDETITVGNDRGKLVKGHEVETTWLTRTEVTGIDRTELTGANRTTVVGTNQAILVKSNADERIGGHLRQSVGGSVDMVVGGSRREHLGGSEHLWVSGDYRTFTGGGYSLIVSGERHEKVSGRFAMEVDEEIHIKGKKKVILEVGEDFCIKGPGGFIRISAEGVIIKGNMVKINSGGAPISGEGTQATLPDTAAGAVVDEPLPPEPDDVARTGLKQ